MTTLRRSASKTPAGRHYPLTRIGPFVRFVRSQKGKAQWQAVKEWGLGDRRDAQTLASEIETSRRVPDDDVLTAFATWAPLPFAFVVDPPDLLRHLNDLDGRQMRRGSVVSLELLLHWRAADQRERAVWHTEGRQLGRKRAVKAKKRKKPEGGPGAPAEQRIIEADSAELIRTFGTFPGGEPDPGTKIRAAIPPTLPDFADDARICRLALAEAKREIETMQQLADLTKDFDDAAVQRMTSWLLQFRGIR